MLAGPLGAALEGAWALASAFFRAYRIWLPYYITGAVGLAFIIIFVGQATPLQWAMEAGIASAAYYVCNLAGIPVRVFDADPASVMVFVVGQAVGSDQGWTLVQVTIESSSLLEIGVLAGAVAFYPASDFRTRLGLVLLGSAATYAASILRMAVVIATLHFFGKESLYIAHTVVGRAVFFLLVIAMFWCVITLPTLRTVAKKLERELTA